MLVRGPGDPNLLKAHEAWAPTFQFSHALFVSPMSEPLFGGMEPESGLSGHGVSFGLEWIYSDMAVAQNSTGGVHVSTYQDNPFCYRFLSHSQMKESPLQGVR